MDPTADPGAYAAGLPASSLGGPASPGPQPSHGSDAASGQSAFAGGQPAFPDGQPAFEGAGEASGQAAFGGEGGGFGLAHPSGPEDGSRWWGMRPAARRPWRRTVAVTVLTAAVVMALGGPLGLLWAWIAPSVPVIATGENIVVNDPSPEEYIAADGWYTILGLAFGLLAAVVAWLLLRRDRGPFLLLGVVAGTLGAGYLVAPWVGEMIGKSAYEHWQDTATRGATYLAPPEVHSTGPMLVPAFAAAILLTLLAGWSNDPDLENPGAKPGYGPNTAAAGGSWPGDPASPAPDAAPVEPAHQPQMPAEPPRA
ncbi:hypothetical protein ACQP2F_09875 [Actinoplanes sp. CA-030573]|uniref:hypothetical protein n=1 Tax=Actinoplanes sp. CA-030573 TaxID=3239898 RepID=UPI003D8C02C3